MLERELAALEDGARAVAFASGMAALSAVTRLAARGRIVAGLVFSVNTVSPLAV